MQDRFRISAWLFVWASGTQWMVAWVKARLKTSPTERPHMTLSARGWVALPTDPRRWEVFVARAITVGESAGYRRYRRESAGGTCRPPTAGGASLAPACLKRGVYGGPGRVAASRTTNRPGRRGSPLGSSPCGARSARTGR
jgi:hypothetical protein